MSDLDLAYASASELTRLIRTGGISPVEVVRNTLNRIDEVDRELNCFCFVYAEEALDAARAVERAMVAGNDLPPLAGVPVAFKDLTPTKGKRTTMGSRVYENWSTLR